MLAGYPDYDGFTIYYPAHKSTTSVIKDHAAKLRSYKEAPIGAPHKIDENMQWLPQVVHSNIRFQQGMGESFTLFLFLLFPAVLFLFFIRLLDMQMLVNVRDRHL